ncbi:MAG: right-handed parallel beta-helix repeat-containing protein, partial [Dehalococcoidia bacterium]|nr:right-handed parallel beta-helix repeat-containing protein [Dehalococcoidia bacterium]
MKKRLLSLLVCIAILTTTVLVGAAGNPVKAATLTVGPEGYSTIQAAIDAAADDDTIVVAAGTYSGTANGEVFPITVDKRVTLLGAQANVDPRPSQGGRTGGESIIDGEETSDTVLQILASGVEVNGFTITGGTYDIVRESGFDSENMLQGLLFRYNIIYDSVAPGDEGIQIAYSDSVVIEYNYAHDIFQDAFNICYSSNGVIRYNEAHDSQSENAAIYCYGTIDTDIIGNLVYNVDHGDDQHGNGIQLGDAGDGGSGGVIRDNVIHDVAQDGICVDDMTGVTIENNTVYGADSWDGAVYLRTVHNSTFTNNRIYNNDAIGVLIQDSSTITLSGNSICSNADTNDTKYPGTAGIWITADSDASTIAIHSNNIHANTEYGATNLDTLHTLSATGNWWGESSGPYHPSANPTGSGNPVSDNVDFSSWETGPFAMTWYVSPGESIQEVVDAAHVGDTVVVAAGTYVGKVTVNKTLTLNGANMGISAGATPGTRGPESVIQGGVQIQADDVVFDGFTIDGPATTGQIDGIYIVGGTSGLTIANNVLAGDGRAQASDGWAMEFGYYTSAITVRNNYVGNWWSTYINPTNSGSNLLFEGNHFDNNHVGIGSDGLNDVTIQYNKFTGNNLEAFGTSNVGSNIQVYDNDFVSNAAGINHYGGGQAVDAADNWWGDNTGPYHATSNPGGLGDEVNGNVSFIPWTGMTAPAVTSVLPNQGEQGQTLTGVVIAGTNFVGIESGGISFGAGITVNSFTVNSATQITASITIAADATPAARDVTVTNYIGTGTLTGGFTVTFSGTIGTPSLVSPDNGAEVSGTSVSFEWSAVPGAVNYKLLVSTSTSIFDTSKYKCNMLVGNVTTYLDTGYPGTGTKYYWWVWAYDAGGNSSPWAQVSANRRDFTSVPSLGAPALISPANAAEVPGTSVSFEWSSVTGAVDYKLLVSTSTNI